MKEIRFGVLGLCRGWQYGKLIPGFEGCSVAAVCDHSPAYQERHRRNHPDIPLCDTFEELLAADIDAVVIAGYCTEHAPQAVQALRAGKHVLSEVTAFHTLAQGVALARVVDETGLTYMMGANSLFILGVEEMVHLARSGRLGEFMYAEAEYVHNLPIPFKRHFDGSIHWRLWQPCIYYCTHSLSPVLRMTGDRPVSVVGMDTGDKIAREWGYTTGRADLGVGLVKMASGGVVRVMVTFANSRLGGHFYKYYGTKGCMENDRIHQDLLHVRERDNPLTDGWVTYAPRRRYLAKEIATLGAPSGAHGGADYVILYEFVKALRDGAPSPLGFYEAADATIPGILAHRSAREGGRPFAVPDLRDEAVRKEYENDDWSPLADAMRRSDMAPS
ncbi:MAG: Gfo/Idh/MocA family oxidoreductase [Armatimonadetes bacterium]|nr:Gfo/Idh/MocA family oxidoreductase [Armatimonadota bacterium]